MVRHVNGSAGAWLVGFCVWLVGVPFSRDWRLFSIMTQALTYALLLAFFRNEMGFGGNNGLTDFKEILGFSCKRIARRLPYS